MKNVRSYCVAVIIEGTLLAMASPLARAQDTTADGYVTRKEYEELKVQMLAMKKELDALKKEKEAVPKQESVETHAVAVRKRAAAQNRNAGSREIFRAGRAIDGVEKLSGR